MRLILQRVSRARVTVGDEVVGAIGRGLVVLVGIEPADGEREVELAATRLVTLRIFDDPAGKMNLDLAQAGGAILLVSQFTLLANLERGRRPSFERAAAPGVAAPLVDELARRLESKGARVERGRFGARMAVELVNDGPVTIALDLPAAR